MGSISILRLFLNPPGTCKLYYASLRNITKWKENCVFKTEKKKRKGKKNLLGKKYKHHANHARDTSNN